MKESFFWFGAYQHLFGVYTEGNPNSDLPTVLLWNTGISNHTGPNRINVEIARRLSQLGHNCLRFDLSGLGESCHRKDGSSGQEKNNLDTKDAIEFAKSRFGAKKFLLIGNCSGAVDAHFASLESPEVAAVALVDGYVYPTFKYYLHYYGKRILKADRWMNFLRRKPRKLPEMGKKIYLKTITLACQN